MSNAALIQHHTAKAKTSSPLLARVAEEWAHFCNITIIVGITFLAIAAQCQ